MGDFGGARGRCGAVVRGTPPSSDDEVLWHPVLLQRGTLHGVPSGLEACVWVVLNVYYRASDPFAVCSRQAAQIDPAEAQDL